MSNKFILVPLILIWDQIFKLLMSPGIDSKKYITPAFVAWRDDMTMINRVVIPACQSPNLSPVSVTLVPLWGLGTK